MVTNGTWTIVGAGFLDKSPAKPLMVADFSAGVLAPNSTLGIVTSFSGLKSMQYTASSYSGGGAIASDSTGNWTIGVGGGQNFTLEGQHVYNFKNLRRNFQITSATQNWKIWRMWASDNDPNVYYAENNNFCNVEYVGDASSSCHRPVSDNGNFTCRRDATTWCSHETIFRASSAPDQVDAAMDGYVEHRFNAQATDSATLRTRATTCSTIGADYMTINYIVHEQLANKGSWVPAWDASWRSEVDNLYMDMTWSRVMLGNASTYAACTKVMPQPPTVWNATNISGVANTAGFSNGAAWLYVFDKNGLFNSTGLAVTVGGSTSAPAPDVQTVTPSTGTTLGGTIVVIGGLNFIPGLTVLVGASTGTVTSVSADGRSIDFRTSPAAAATGLTVKVTNPDAQFDTLASTFSYIQAAPTVTSVSPNTVLTTGGTRVQANGTNFLAQSTVSVSGTAGTSVSVLTSTAIIFTTPAKSAGTYNVTVSSGGLSGTGSAVLAYVLPAPTLVSHTPSTGTTLGGTVVAFTVTNAVSGCTIQFGTMTALTATFTSSSLVSSTAPARSTAGAVTTKITNPDGQNASLVNSYTYVAPVAPTPPTVTSVTPSTVLTTGGQTIQINGANFLAQSTASISGTTCTSPNVLTSTAMTCVTPIKSSATYNVTVSSGGLSGTGTNVITYQLPAPTFTAVTPSTGTTAGGTTVALTVTNAVTGCTVFFGATAAASVIFTDATHVSAVTPLAGGSTVAVTFQNPDGQSVILPNAFTFVAPATGLATLPWARFP